MSSPTPADYGSNHLKHTCLKTSSESKELDEMLQVFLIRAGAELCSTPTLREHVWKPLLYGFVSLFKKIMFNSRIPGEQLSYP